MLVGLYMKYDQAKVDGIADDASRGLTREFKGASNLDHGKALRI